MPCGYRTCYSLTRLQHFIPSRSDEDFEACYACGIQPGTLGKAVPHFRKQVMAIQERGGTRHALRFHDGVKVSVSICRCVNHGFGSRWIIPVNRFERDYPTLICTGGTNTLTFTEPPPITVN